MTKERIAEIEQYAKQGLSSGEAAKMMGMTKGQVIGAAYRSGIRFHGIHQSQIRIPLDELMKTPCVNGHSREDAYIMYCKRSRRNIIKCRKCHSDAGKRYWKKKKGNHIIRRG